MESVSLVSGLQVDAANVVTAPPSHADAPNVETVPVHSGFFIVHVQPLQMTFALATASMRTGNPVGHVETGESCAMQRRKPVERMPQ
jgi:hypothetical protein